MSRIKRQKWIGLIYVSPFIVGLLVFVLYPFISSMYYSFTDYGMIREPTFVGFSNYIYMFKTDPLFFQSVKVTLIYVIVAVPFKIGFALFIAVILNINIRVISLYRTLYYLPSILAGSVAISVVWRSMFMEEGVVNSILTNFGLSPIRWLSSPMLALFSISLLAVWQFGSSMVLFLAGLKQIPKELYEAGKVDGASRFTMFFKITFPMLSPIVLFNVIMQTINAFQDFTAPYIITSGGPLNATYLLSFKLYEDAFHYSKLGYASALSWILFFCMMVFTLLFFASSRRWVHYEDGGQF